jgi:hypothetical protein
MICSVSLSQDVYQASVLKGFSMQANAGVQLWKSSMITDKSAIIPAFGIGAMYGFSESLFVYFRYQNSLKGKLSDKEIDFNIFSKKANTASTAFGLGYAFGKPSSSLKYYAKVGISIQNTNITIYDFNSDLELQLNLSGWSPQLAIGVLYYLQPFLSIGLEGGGEFGKYRQSEFLGLSYKEKMAFNTINAMLSINYHFNGR